MEFDWKSSNNQLKNTFSAVLRSIQDLSSCVRKSRRSQMTAMESAWVWPSRTWKCRNQKDRSHQNTTCVPEMRLGEDQKAYKHNRLNDPR